jgi:hypothetical protein
VNGAGSRRGDRRGQGRIESMKDVERCLCHLEFSFSDHSLRVCENAAYPPFGGA